jgi:hypothetical protein
MEDSGEIMASSKNRPSQTEALLAVLPRIVRDLEKHHPRAVLLYGSMARWRTGYATDTMPGDIDVLVVGDQTPVGVEAWDYGYPTEIHRMRVHTLTEIARSLRYDTRPIALSKLYGNQLIKQHADKVVAACLLLGPDYRSFGIEQIEVDGQEDRRDYSVHEVLLGQEWWQKVVDYTRERRGPLRRFSDKIVGREFFVDR